jgi:Uma2 family endonuclease
MSQNVVLMTTEDLLALPEDGVDRELIRGELRERPFAYRDRLHGGTEATLTAFLSMWSLQQPSPRGTVYSGEVGCVLRRDPDTTVGIDVAYLTPEMVARQPDTTKLIDGAPLLAVEILSPNDKLEDLDDKIDEYLAAGVALIWVVNPHRQTVVVHRPDVKACLLNAGDELTAEPHLPGFRVPVAAIFE